MKLIIYLSLENWDCFRDSLQIKLLIRYKYNHSAFLAQMQNNQKMTPQYMSVKAGMDSVNKQMIARKVAEMTKGTPKDLHEKQLQKKRALQVSSMVEKIMKFSQQQRKQIKQHWKNKICQISEKRPLHRYWAHFDFDMFYVACELLDKPELKDKPCAVGGDNDVLSTANYAARLQGLRSAMPTFIAKQLCPEVTLFKSDFQKYRHFSNIFREILKKYDENLEYQGLDQAYVDMTHYLQNHTIQQQHKILGDIRQDIFDKTGLTVSAGVGANKMLAKIASEVKKPNDQYILQNDTQQIKEFMKGMKVRKIPGIGPVNQYYLKGLGIQTACDILQNSDMLSICFSDISCQYFIEASLGLGDIDHSHKQRKSVGRSQTFKPTNSQQFLLAKLLELCAEVAVDLQQLGFVSINAVLTYQYDNYQKKDKAFSLDGYHKDKQTLYKATVNQLKSIISHNKLRLLGVRCSNLMKYDQWKRKSLQNYFIKKRSVSTDESRKYLLNQVREATTFLCPICNKDIECSNNISAFNRHVDKCLKGFSQTAQVAIKQEQDKIKVEQKLQFAPQKFKIEENNKAKSKSTKSTKNIKKTNATNLDSFLKKK